MLEVIKSKIDLDELLQASSKLSYWTDGSGCKMSVKQSGGLPFSGPFGKALSEIKFLRNLSPLNMMINVLPPGIIVPKHRDFLEAHPVLGKHPRLERWHLPLKTDEYASYWIEGFGTRCMLLGHWYGPFPYWKSHYITNDGTENRVHLVIDLETLTNIGEYE